MFIDQARIYVKAGQGGDGACSFRREKYVPYGGPDGGDGGNGGHVVMIASNRITTLLDLRYQRHYEAQSGRAAQKADRHGRTGSDTVIRVPIGTIVKDDSTGETLADLVHDGQSVIVAHGGRGGKGNARFVSSTNRAPRQFETGTQGEAHWLTLELKLLADVGLVGFPNAGKSTLISSISSAHPEIASYPFTTLRPYLGVVSLDEVHSFVVADIPGLLEGAHQGKGLGFQFLRHIQRTAFLLYLIDASEWTPEDPVSTFTTLRKELANYDSSLEQRSFAVVGTKLDIKGNEQNLGRLRDYCERHHFPFFAVSAVTREGLDSLVQHVGSQVERARAMCESNC